MEAGRELDALVAEKVMGWKRKTYAEEQPSNQYYKDDHRLTFYWYDENSKETKHARESGCSVCGTDFPAWSPSTDIAAAWEVVEKVRSMSKYTKCFSLQADNVWHGGYRAWFRKDEADGDIECSAEGDSPAHSICLAALKAVE